MMYLVMEQQPQHIYMWWPDVISRICWFLLLFEQLLVICFLSVVLCVLACNLQGVPLSFVWSHSTRIRWCVQVQVGSLKIIFICHTGSGSGPQPPPVTPRTPYHSPQPTYSPDKPRFGPNICDGHFDSIAILRGEMFVFKVSPHKLVGLLMRQFVRQAVN